MTIIFHEGVKQYKDAIDMAQAWQYTNPPSIYQGSGPGGAAEFSGGSDIRLGGAYALVKNISPVAKVCASFDLRTGSASANFRLALSPSGYYSRASTNITVLTGAIRIEGTASATTIYYDILTGATGTTVNSLILATLPALLPNTTYHFEMKVDHTNPTAELELYINRALAADVSYSRDRLVNGYQALNFATLQMVSLTGAATMARFSNLVCYADDASHVFPVGGMQIDYLTTADANLSVGPAVDTTVLNVQNMAFNDLPLSNIVAGADVIGAALHYRLAAAAGQDTAVCEVALESLGNQIGVTQSHSIAPGYVPSLHTVPLGALSEAVLNGLSFKARSVTA